MIPTAVLATATAMYASNVTTIQTVTIIQNAVITNASESPSYILANHAAMIQTADPDTVQAASASNAATIHTATPIDVSTILVLIADMIPIAQAAENATATPATTDKMAIHADTTVTAAPIDALTILALTAGTIPIAQAAEDASTTAVSMANLATHAIMTPTANPISARIKYAPNAGMIRNAQTIRDVKIISVDKRLAYFIRLTSGLSAKPIRPFAHSYWPSANTLCAV